MLGLCYAFWGLGYLITIVIKIPFNVNSSIFAQVSTII